MLDLEKAIDIGEKDDMEVLRPAKMTVPESNAFTAAPCGLCPVSSTTPACTGAAALSIIMSSHAAPSMRNFRPD